MAEWLARAACRDVNPDVFFSEAPRLTAARARDDAQALTICRSCPVVPECRQAGDDAETDIFHIFGIHGGETPKDRLRRRGRLRPLGAVG